MTIDIIKIAQILTQPLNFLLEPILQCLYGLKLKLCCLDIHLSNEFKVKLDPGHSLTHCL